MFNWLYELLGKMMSFFSDVTGSYILALLFYALIFKVVFIPFAIKQQKNQIKMAALAPKIQLIKAKYKGRSDQQSMQKQQQEIMELQQKEGYNGCSGCMPMLIQLPIIMLLYAVIQSPLSYMARTTDVVDEYNKNYENAEYVTPESLAEIYGEDLYTYNEKDGTKSRVELTDAMIVAKLKDRYFSEEDKNNKKANEITLISRIYDNVDDEKFSAEVIANEISIIEKYGIEYDSIPNFRLGKTNLAETPKIAEPSIIVIIPFVAAIASWLTMFLSRKLNGNSNPAMAAGDAANSTQARQSMMIMDITMPLMTLFIAFGFSGMLGLYWIIQSTLGLLQTFIVSRAMPIPRFTEEQLKELRRQEKEVEKAARAAAKVTRHRSLHYIDEDDYDELPEAPQNESGKKSVEFKGDAPEIKD